MHKNIDTLIFDLNGTLYQKGIPVAGAIDTIKALRNKGYHMNFVTNTDGRSIGDVHKRVVDMGFGIEVDELLTPVSAAKRFISTNKDKSYFLLVDDDLNNDLEAAVINDKNPDYVVIGDFSRKLDYDIINKVFRMIKDGAEIIALSQTLWYIDVDGYSINTGSFVNMFETACDKKSILLGKPSKEFLNMALLRTNSIVENTMVIGDDLKTDIYGGKSIGAVAVQVKTGVYNPEEIKDCKHKPDFIIDSISSLTDLLEK